MTHGIISASACAGLVKALELQRQGADGVMDIEIYRGVAPVAGVRGDEALEG